MIYGERGVGWVVGSVHAFDGGGCFVFDFHDHGILTGFELDQAVDLEGSE